eukprot:7168502-Prymnesium_polylepis.1
MGLRGPSIRWVGPLPCRGPLPAPRGDSNSRRDVRASRASRARHCKQCRAARVMVERGRGEQA